MKSFQFPILEGLGVPEIVWNRILEEADNLTSDQIGWFIAKARNEPDQPSNPTIGVLNGDEMRMMIVAQDIAKSSQTAIDNSDDAQGKIFVKNLADDLCRIIKYAVVQHWLKEHPWIVILPGHTAFVCGVCWVKVCPVIFM